jgi:hypothetical protein
VLKRLLVAAMLLPPTLALAQVEGPAVFSPTAPDNLDLIQATFIRPGLCFYNTSTVVMGTVVRTTVNVHGCITGPPSFQTSGQASFGPLPPATYTYEIYMIYRGGPLTFVSQQPLTVTAELPTLSGFWLAALATALAAVALFATMRPVT